MEWQVYVRLRSPLARSHRDRRQANAARWNEELTSNKSSTAAEVEATVEVDNNPLKWNVYVRRYGSGERQVYNYLDTNNTLDPPITENKTYRFELPDPIQANVAYEICVQSVNSGNILQSEHFKQTFPVNALTTIVGQLNNPSFVCKEVTLTNDKINDSQLVGSQVSNVTLPQQTSGRSIQDGISVANIEMNEQTADTFMVYTAVSSGSTTVFLLIVLVLFCCCKCGQRKDNVEQHRNIRYLPADRMFSTR